MAKKQLAEILELLQSLDLSTAGPAGACSGILRGITFRRVLRLEALRPRSLIERISASRLPRVPTAEFWNDASSAPLRKTLQEWDSGNLAASFPFVWWHIEQLKLVLPYLKPALRALVDAPETTRTAYYTCVVHFRAGDFFIENVLEELVCHSWTLNPAVRSQEVRRKKEGSAT